MGYLRELINPGQYLKRPRKPAKSSGIAVVFAPTQNRQPPLTTIVKKSEYNCGPKKFRSSNFEIF